MISELTVIDKKIDIDKLLSSIKIRKLKNELIEINKKLKSEGIKKELLEKRKLIMEKLNILTKESGVVSKTLY